MSAEDPTNLNEPQPEDKPPAELDEEIQVETAPLTTDSRFVDEQIDFAQGKSLQESKDEWSLQEKKRLFDYRTKNIPVLFELIVGWLTFVGILLLLSGWHICNFELSEKIVIALITSTTANVLGLFYVVAKWLYPAPATKKRKDKKGKITISGDLNLGGRDEE